MSFCLSVYVSIFTIVIVINDCENVNTSFPEFVALAGGLGLDISQTSE